MIVDLFSGPRGWSEGLRRLGLADIGIEWDEWACRTAVAAGHLTIRADVAEYPPERFAGAEGLIASPPCPDWSTNGQRAGRAGNSGWLIDLVPRWVGVVRPRWIACEQVPPALEVWEEFAGTFATWGYSTWTGVLNAADFGVPQTRKRAILMASRANAAVPPEPTHSDHRKSPDLWLAPWASMAEAVGWDAALVLDTRRDQREDGSTQIRTVDRPAPTVSTIPGQWQWVDGVGARRAVTRAELAAFQGFRPDYPWQGPASKVSEQIGNAIPPGLAAAVVGALTGRQVQERAA